MSERCMMGCHKVFAFLSMGADIKANTRGLWFER